MEIRKICPEDAGTYLALLNQLDSETNFMLFEPGERRSTVEDVKSCLQKAEDAEHEVTFVAEEDGKLVGYIKGCGGVLKRNRGNVCLTIGVLQDYSNRGIGTGLFDALEDWAKARPVNRLELTVMEHNRPAMMLFDKCGFHVEGMRKHALQVEKKVANEFYMAKFIRGGENADNIE